MSPVRTPKPKPSANAKPDDTLMLFFKNMEEIKRWYRQAAGSGHEMGHIVLSEMIIGCVSAALEAAMKGEAWVPPTEHP